KLEIRQPVRCSVPSTSWPRAIPFRIKTRPFVLMVVVLPDQLGRHTRMPKKVLGTNGTHRANSPTSVRMLRLGRRGREALEGRLRGDSFAAIAQKMGVSEATAHNDIVHSLQSVGATRENKEAVLELELGRLDKLQGAVADAALKGDTAAIETTL